MNPQSKQRFEALPASSPTSYRCFFKLQTEEMRCPSDPGRVLRLTFVLALATLSAGCATQFAQRAQNADGLLDFIFGKPRPDVVPVERVSKGGGVISTAHAVADENGLRVSGYVRKSGMFEPTFGSHVDLLVIDAQGRTTAAVATDYFPRPMPRETSRSGIGRSYYAATFPFIPHAGSQVRVVFHGAPKNKCEFATGS